MGLIFGLIKRLFKLAIYTVLFITVVTLIPNLPPYAKFSSIELEPTLPREGKLQSNSALNNAQKLYEDKLKGPECFALYNGEVYTGSATGEIVKLSPGGHVTYITQIGDSCEGAKEPERCSRPLGLDIDEKTGQMYVADANQGIWKVDIKTGKKQLLVSPRVEIEGQLPMFFNSLAVSKNGDLYWTDTSGDFRLTEVSKAMMADPSGRLLYYNAASNKSKVLLDDLWFANGVVISPDYQFVVVAETNSYRLQKYYIDGPKKGKSEVFIGGLPGFPDNLRVLPDGSGFTVAMFTMFKEDEPNVAKSLAKTPAIRKFLARIFTLIEMPFTFLNRQFPSPVVQKLAETVNFNTLTSVMTGSPGLLVVDWNGNIVESYFNTDGSIGQLTDAIVFQDKLLTGSVDTRDSVGAVPAPPLLKKAYSSVQIITPKKKAESSKPATQKPVEKKPETTTAKPTTTTKPPTTTTKPPTTTTKPPTTTTKPPTTTTTKPSTTTTKQPTTTTKPSTTTTKQPTTTTKPPTTTTKPLTTTTKPLTTTTKPPTTTTKPPTTTTKPPTTTTKPPTTTTKPPPTTTKPPTTTTNPPTTTTKPPTTTTKQPKQKPTTPPPQEPEIIVERVEKKEQIPIIEEIPSDTMKPTKEKLKVIKKGGPTEIPNPAL